MKIYHQRRADFLPGFKREERNPDLVAVQKITASVA